MDISENILIGIENTFDTRHYLSVQSSQYEQNMLRRAVLKSEEDIINGRVISHASIHKKQICR